METMKEVLTGDEQILWEGKPALLPFFASAILSLVLGAGLLAILARFVAGQPSREHTDLVAAFLFLSPFLLAGFLLAIACPIWRVLAYLRLSYAITTQRVVFQSGVIEHNVAMVDFDQIAHANAEIDLTDIFLGFGRTGSVWLTTRPPCDPDQDDADKTPHVLSHIPHPYDVFRLFHRAEYDVKTDIDYPNRLRPDTNPGYPTTYPPDIP
jgi:hypothetical protein